ncbi:MAG: hypothetical protein HPY53_08535 [Brevinematales bacterium]|nr:hypothetical protein [Brevinematales bacterium]
MKTGIRCFSVLVLFSIGMLSGCASTSMKMVKGQYYPAKPKCALVYMGIGCYRSSYYGSQFKIKDIENSFNKSVKEFPIERLIKAINIQNPNSAIISNYQWDNNNFENGYDSDALSDYIIYQPIVASKELVIGGSYSKGHSDGYDTGVHYSLSSNAIKNYLDKNGYDIAIFCFVDIIGPWKMHGSYVTVEVDQWEARIRLIAIDNNSLIVGVAGVQRGKALNNIGYGLFFNEFTGSSIYSKNYGNLFTSFYSFLDQGKLKFDKVYKENAFAAWKTNSIEGGIDLKIYKSDDLISNENMSVNMDYISYYLSSIIDFK